MEVYLVYTGEKFGGGVLLMKIFSSEQKAIEHKEKLEKLVGNFEVCIMKTKLDDVNYKSECIMKTERDVPNVTKESCNYRYSPPTTNEIDTWLIEAQMLNAKYLMIAIDTFDESNYPVYANNDDELKKKYEERDGVNMTEIKCVISVKDGKYLYIKGFLNKKLF